MTFFEVHNSLAPRGSEVPSPAEGGWRFRENRRVLTRRQRPQSTIDSSARVPWRRRLPGPGPGRRRERRNAPPSAERFAEAIPGATLELLAGVGHHVEVEARTGSPAPSAPPSDQGESRPALEGPLSAQCVRLTPRRAAVAVPVVLAGEQRAAAEEQQPDQREAHDEAGLAPVEARRIVGDIRNRGRLALRRRDLGVASTEQARFGFDFESG